MSDLPEKFNTGKGVISKDFETPLPVNRNISIQNEDLTMICYKYTNLIHKYSADCKFQPIENCRISVEVIFDYFKYRGLLLNNADFSDYIENIPADISESEKMYDKKSGNYLYKLKRRYCAPSKWSFDNMFESYSDAVLRSKYIKVANQLSNLVLCGFESESDGRKYLL